MACKIIAGYAAIEKLHFRQPSVVENQLENLFIDVDGRGGDLRTLFAVLVVEGALPTSLLPLLVPVGKEITREGRLVTGVSSSIPSPSWLDWLTFCRMLVVRVKSAR